MDLVMYFKIGQATIIIKDDTYRESLYAKRYVAFLLRASMEKMVLRSVDYNMWIFATILRYNLLNEATTFRPLRKRTKLLEEKATSVLSISEDKSSKDITCNRFEAIMFAAVFKYLLFFHWIWKRRVYTSWRLDMFNIKSLQKFVSHFHCYYKMTTIWPRRLFYWRFLGESTLEPFIV